MSVFFFHCLLEDLAAESLVWAVRHSHFLQHCLAVVDHSEESWHVPFQGNPKCFLHFLLFISSV